MHVPTQKRIVIILAILLSSYSVLTNRIYCQNKTSMIVGGIDLTLGANRDEVLNKFANDRFKLSDLGNDAWMIFRKSLQSDELEPIGSIQFIKGKLHSASRDWAQSQNKAGIDLMGSLFSALSGLTAKTGTDAVILTYQNEQPGISHRAINIYVGGRTLFVSITKDASMKSEQVEIQERIQQE